MKKRLTLTLIIIISIAFGQTGIEIAKMVDVTGWKAVGSKLTDFSKTIEMQWESRPNDPNAQPELFG